MAISVAWQTTATSTAATSTLLYTSPAATSATFAYARDLVINNGGTANLYVSASPSATSAATVTGFLIPGGGTILLTQSQVPVSTVIYGMTPVTGPVNIGFATNVAFT